MNPPRPIRDSRRDPTALVIFAFAFVGGGLVGVFVLCFGFVQGWWP